MAIKHIVWDWNGTLLNDVQASANALKQMLEKRNMGTLTLEEYREKIVFPAKELYDEAGFDIEKETYEMICDEYIENYIRNYRLIDLHKDALDVLRKFHQKGIKQHIVSASGKDILDQQIEKFGIKEFFTYVFGLSSNHAGSKAHLANALSELIDCSSEEVLMIGDTVHDFEVSKEAGFKCCLVSNGYCSERRLKSTGMPVFPDLTALYGTLLNRGELE